MTHRGGWRYAAAALGLALAASVGAAVGPQEVRKPMHVPPTGYVAMPKSRLSERGRLVYARLKCAACHAIAGEGGRNGPPLDGIGARRNEAFLTAKISDPRAFVEQYPDLTDWEPSRMAHAGVGPADVKAIVAYLRTLPEPAGGFAVGQHAEGAEDPGWTPPATFAPGPMTETARRGRTLFFNMGCAECHAIGRLGGWFGPRLDGIGERHSRGFVAAHVSSPSVHAMARPKSYPHGSMMPRLELTPGEVDAITEFLLTVPFAGDVESAPEGAAKR